ncbi:hypothetical protein ANTRET_LOCUS6734 [Anthophora retusa]
MENSSCANHTNYNYENSTKYSLINNSLLNYFMVTFENIVYVRKVSHCLCEMQKKKRKKNETRVTFLDEYSYRLLLEYMKFVHLKFIVKKVAVLVRNYTNLYVRKVLQKLNISLEFKLLK